MEENHICIARKTYFSCGVERAKTGNCGYNYTFEVFLYGPIDRVTGLVINLTDVNIALNEIGMALDQKNLNHDIKDLESVDLFSFHQFVHRFFETEFAKLKPKDIDILKTSLVEGEGGVSHLVTPKGKSYFNH